MTAPVSRFASVDIVEAPMPSTTSSAFRAVYPCPRNSRGVHRDADVAAGAHGHCHDDHLARQRVQGGRVDRVLGEYTVLAEGDVPCVPVHGGSPYDDRQPGCP